MLFYIDFHKTLL